jgi:hypothetical protein
MGQNVLLDSPEEGFGKKPTELIREAYIQELNRSRKDGFIKASTVIATSTPIKAKTNTFYGN